MKQIVRLMADYDCWPLWWTNGDGDIDPKSLPLSPATVDRLIRWAEAFDVGLNRKDPASSEWPSEEAYQEFKREGYALWLIVRRELAGDYIVLYQDGSAVFDEPEEYQRYQISG